MAHRGQPAAPRAILTQGVGVNPPLILHQLDISQDNSFDNYCKRRDLFEMAR